MINIYFYKFKIYSNKKYFIYQIKNNKNFAYINNFNFLTFLYSKIINLNQKLYIIEINFIFLKR